MASCKATRPSTIAMYHEAQLLNHLIDDLRTLSLADAGELPLNRGLLPPGECARTRRRLARRLAAQHGVRLDVQVAPDLPLIDVDRERMAQVLANLVGNALRYTPEGGVITLSAEADGDRVLLRVSDTGPGIGRALPFIFERFTAPTTSGRPTGLGAGPGHRPVAGRGARRAIQVESVVGQGAIFTVALARNWKFPAEPEKRPRRWIGLPSPEAGLKFPAEPEKRPQALGTGLPSPEGFLTLSQ